MNSFNAIEISKLNKTYRNGIVALKNINLTIKSGSFFGLLGLNGAGKSTLIGIISSLIIPGDGDIKLMGYNLRNETSFAKKNIGVVPQESNLNNFEKCRVIIRNQGRFYGLPRRMANQKTDELLKMVGLWDKRNKISNDLSGGMKRRLMIARALIHNPKLLILDEPTAGVDVEIRKIMWNMLKNLNKQGMTILLTTHYLEEAQTLCKELAIIHKGEIIKHESTKNLLHRLNSKLFTLHLKEPLSKKNLYIKEFSIKKINDMTLKVIIRKNQNISNLINKLQEYNILIQDISVPSNQLELIFTDILSEKYGENNE